MTKSEYNVAIMTAAINETYAVLDRPKNLAKPVMGEDLFDLFYLAKGEMQELQEEIENQDIDYAKVKAEAADTIAYLAGIIYACDGYEQRTR